MKYSKIRFVGFLVLFYLIIWGALKLMISTVGGEKSAGAGIRAVYVLSAGLQSETLAGDWVTQLTDGDYKQPEVLALNDFMELPVSRGAVIIAASGWLETTGSIPDPLVKRMAVWADSGARILIYGYYPDERAVNDTFNIKAGFYTTRLTLSGDSTVLWIESQPMPVVCRACTEVLASAIVNGKPVPVIWKEKRSKGTLLFCIPNLPVSPGAENLLDQLIAGNDTLVARERLLAKPGIVDETVFREHMRALMSEDPGGQLSAINWFAETQHPAGRKVLLPFLYSDRRQVVVAAAEALVALRARGSIPFIRSASGVQPDELKPVLLKAVERISASFDEQGAGETKKH